MKKLLRTIPIAALLLAAGYATQAQAAVTGTMHDLTTGAVSTADAAASVCGFCHSPHTEAGGPAPLWNRGAAGATGTFTMYTSPTMDMALVSAGTPVGISMACLSCHDGATALDNLINGGGSGGYNAAGASQGWTFVGTTAPIGGFMNPASVTTIGNDLSGDHPISIVYDDTLDPSGFNTLAAVQATTLQLYGGGANQVECATCHDPHDTTNPTFLRVPASGLCSTCHTK